MIPPVRPWHTTLQAGHSSPPLRIQPALSVLSPRINREPRVLHAPQTDLPPEHPPPRLEIRIVIPGRLIPEVAILKRNEMGSDAGGVKSRESDPARKKLRRVERKSGNPSPMLVACNLGEPPPWVVTQPLPARSVPWASSDWGEAAGRSERAWRKREFISPLGSPAVPDSAPHQDFIPGAFTGSSPRIAGRGSTEVHDSGSTDHIS